VFAAFVAVELVSLSVVVAELHLKVELFSQVKQTFEWLIELE
jgi:hypothetical protein